MHRWPPSSVALAFVLIVGSTAASGKETPRQESRQEDARQRDAREEEARRQSERIDAENRARGELVRRERALQQWVERSRRIAAPDANAEQRREGSFRIQRRQAHENLFVLARALEQLYVLDPAVSPDAVDRTASDAADAVDTVRDFVTWNVDRDPDAGEEVHAVHYREGIDRLVSLFRDLMLPMAVLMDGQTLDLAMHDKALAILGHMEHLLEELPGLAPLP